MPCIVLQPPRSWAEEEHRGFTLHSIVDVRWVRTLRTLYVVQPLYHPCAGRSFSLDDVAVRPVEGGPWARLNLLERREVTLKDGSTTSTFAVPEAFDASNGLEVVPTINGRERPPRTVNPLPEPTGDKPLLGVTTLFLRDVYLLERYLDYYRRAHDTAVFLLFYNGPLAGGVVEAHVQQCLSRSGPGAPTVLLFSWPFQYWQTFCDCRTTEGMWHGAQGTHLAIASIVASRWCTWLLNVDLDEYVAYADGARLLDVLRALPDEDDRALTFRNTFVPCGGFFCGGRAPLPTAHSWTTLPDRLRDFVWRLPAHPVLDRSKFVQRTSPSRVYRGVHMPTGEALDVSPLDARLVHMSCWSGLRRCPGNAPLARLMQEIHLGVG